MVLVLFRSIKNRKTVSMEKKLTTAQKVEISHIQDQSLRSIAKDYGVHHSTIDAIKKESNDALIQLFEVKKAGRPQETKVITPKEYDELYDDFIDVRDKWAKAEMRKDYLEIDHRFSTIRHEALQQELLAEERERLKKKRRRLKNKRKKKK